MLIEILYADDLVLIADVMTELHKKLYTWKGALECKRLKVNLINIGYGE